MKYVILLCLLSFGCRYNGRINVKEEVNFCRIIAALNTNDDAAILSTCETKIVDQSIELDIPLWLIGSVISCARDKQEEHNLFSLEGIRGRLFLTALTSSPKNKTTLLIFSLQSPARIILCSFKDGVLREYHYASHRDDDCLLYDYVITQLTVHEKFFLIKGYYAHTNKSACFKLSISPDKQSWRVSPVR